MLANQSKHIFRKKIWGFHLDFYQHVNNSRYLEFLEEARWEYLEPIKKSKAFEQKGWITIVAHIELSYKQPILLHDEIEIQTWINETGRKSMTFQQQIFKNGQAKLVAEAFIKFVVYDVAAKKSLFIKDEIKSIFKLETMDTL